MQENNLNKLKQLARHFSPYATLYMVGGIVRDMVLGIESEDIDICSQLTVDEVKRILSNTDFAVSTKSLRMGTVHIKSGEFECEYTTFRCDSYDNSSGNHYPKDVVFTKDIYLDAKRRDFACNAVYYDILYGSFCDVVGGIDDIECRIVRTVDDPHIVFEADGLRILRLVRFCAQLGFEPDKETLLVAKQNAWRVKDIASERIRDELCKIFVADTRCNKDKAHLVGLRLLDEIGLVELLLPELNALKGLQQPKQYHLYDAYEHSIKAYEIAPPHLRVASLLHDVGKAYAMQQNGNMHSHEIYGERIVNDILERLRFSNADIDKICALVRWHMIDINGNTSINKLKRFVVEHIDIVEDLILLKNIDGMASIGKLTRENRLKTALDELVVNNIPLSIKQLCIKGQDLIDIGIAPKHRSKVLQQLLIDTVYDYKLTDKDRAIEHIKKIANNLDK